MAEGLAQAWLKAFAFLSQGVFSEMPKECTFAQVDHTAHHAREWPAR